MIPLNKLRFLGVWFDEKLTWKVHLKKAKNKCKKTLKYVVVCQKSLRNIYWVLVRSVFDYGCVDHLSAAESNSQAWAKDL